MTKALRKFFADGGGAAHFTLSYYSPDVDARWSIDVDGDDCLHDRPNPDEEWRCD